MAGYYLRTRSQLDGKPIILSLTVGSKNSKVGDVIQSWILRDRVNPYNAILKGGDESICGDCPRRHFSGGDCYVSMKRGPKAIWDSVKDKRAIILNLQSPPKRLRGKVLRFGAYGDPVAVPLTMWKRIISALRIQQWVGYTHQWKDPKFQSYQQYLMASCDSESDREEAKSKGWRTFRVRSATGAVMLGEFICPASPEGGVRTNCQFCVLCNGLTTRAKDPVIIAHGFKNQKALTALRIGPGVAKMWY